MEGRIIVLPQGCSNASLGLGGIAILELIPDRHQHFPSGFRQGPGCLESSSPGPDHQDIRFNHRRIRRIKLRPIGFHEESSFYKWPPEQQPVTGRRDKGRNPIDGFLRQLIADS